MFDRSVIVFVDDDELVRRATQRLIRSTLRALKQENTHVLLASGGDAALQIVQQHEDEHGRDWHYLLITDGNMPGMNGPELIERLSRKLGDQLISSVIYSANTDFESDAKRLNAGFVRKPSNDLEYHIRHFYGNA